MSKSYLHKVWSGSRLNGEAYRVKKLVTIRDRVSWHFAAFKSLYTPKSRLLDSSYEAGALSGTAGTPYSGRSPSFLPSCFLEQVHKQECREGEKSIWNLMRDGKPVGITVYV